MGVNHTGYADESSSKAVFRGIASGTVGGQSAPHANTTFLIWTKLHLAAKTGARRSAKKQQTNSNSDAQRRR
ncbi:hypothetical protein FE257_011463 [Aspergillus nanangensis]|uniref:Uncharacterized protein n=1 Tax=Aspergillus nanangensis TaxID=2582783 RepID=A0AAD4CH54_ASPNN|nr:hypothetical protein FE257_011463 [Aspergillus nanangensis]